MERSRSKHSSKLLWATLAALLTQNLVIPVASSATFDDRKTYYSPPDPNTPTTPTIPPSSHTPPSHSHRPPTHSHGPPCHGGGTPPPTSNCKCPPSGGHHDPTPSPPSGGGGGGYYNPPPSSTPTPITPTPTIPTPITPTPIIPTPTTPTPITPTPITPTPTIVSPPTIFTPPTTPIDPGTPSIPSPPYAFDPNSPPFTCDYWRTHPGLVWGLLGWWGTVGGAFGVASLPGLGSNANLLQALSNTRTDGLGALYREGTAALLNSMVHKGFPYTTSQVRDSFAAAIGSNKAAAAQAKLFKQANGGRAKPRA